MEPLRIEHGVGETLGTHRDFKSDSMVRYCRGEFFPGVDALALEAPLDIHLNGEHVCKTMRTPGADTDLAAGALFSSGRVSSPEVLAKLGFRETGDAVWVDANEFSVAAKACSLRKDSARVRNASTPIPREELAELLLEMRSVLEKTQRLFRHTGATHCAMFFDRNGAPLSFGEDVGRHNAFDKCVGSALLRNVHGQACHAVISSRLSHEIVSKAVRTGISVLAGFSVATSIALELAQEHGLTLVGRLRDDTMNIYSNART